MSNFLEKLLRTGEKREAHRAQNLVDAIQLVAPTYKEMSDAELKEQTSLFKKRIKDGESLDLLIPETFAVVAEASDRVLGKKQYPVQLMGGIALHFGQVAEMGTGEGKAVTLGTLIPTPEGAIPAGNIRLGDTIYAGTGELTNVTGVFPQGTQKVYRLTTSDGRHIDCNAEHLWDAAIGDDTTHTVTTQQIIEALNADKPVAIPQNGPTAHKKATRSHPGSVLDPKTADICIYLGSSYVSLQGNGTDKWHTLSDMVSFGALMVTMDAHSAGLAHYQLQVEKYREWVSNRDFNISSLLGSTVSPQYTVGIYDPTGSEWQISSLLEHAATVTDEGTFVAHAWSEMNADSVAWLARSMGWGAAIHYDERSLLGWVIEIDKNPAEMVSVVDVVDTGRVEEQVCFTVSHPSHLFLAGDHIVTHNTLTAVAPLYLNALTGKGAHLVTTNDYLAREQAEQMGRIYTFLGMTYGAIQEQMGPEERQSIYARDIVYGTNTQFGFDYLRDNIAKAPEQRVQRGLNYVIIDELDSILIDEAVTPLIISSPADNAEKAAQWFTACAEFMATLKEGEHYTADKKKRTADFEDAGIDAAIDYFGIANQGVLYGEHSELLTFLRAALQAEALYEKNKEYIIQGKEVMIVDEHTGRAMEGRRYSNGIHQALEAKERRNGNRQVEIQPENPTSATITLQNFFRLYDKMSGMTGTAASEAAELADTYGLTVRTIPPNKPKLRADLPDEVYISEKAKFEAVVAEIKQMHEDAEGTYLAPDGQVRPLVQPVLIGTTSVTASEKLSRMLTEANIEHNVLNAKHIEEEAHIIAQAGRLGAVTVSTNMAGRGTDILLGGNAEMLVEERLAMEGLTSEYTPDAYEQRWRELLPIMEDKVSHEREKVRGCGGLYVIGTARHDSRRIDNQLIGRSGRQGDPGKSKFFLSVEDELLRFYGSRSIAAIVRAMSASPDTPISGKIITKAMASAQAAIDGRHRETRKSTLDYDDVLNAQRKLAYSERSKILEGDKDMLLHQTELLVKDSIEQVTRSWLDERGTHLDDWDLKKLWVHLKEKLQWVPSITPKDVLDEYPNSTDFTSDALVYELTSAAKTQWDSRVERDEVMAVHYAKVALLDAIDSEWMAHLADLDYLKEGIGLRSLAQKDPKVEYKIESGDLFNKMTREYIPQAFSKTILGAVS